MIPPIVQVNYEQLKAISRHFGDESWKTSRLQRRMHRDMGRLRDGGWQGDAALALSAFSQPRAAPPTAHASHTDTTTIISYADRLRAKANDHPHASFADRAIADSRGRTATTLFCTNRTLLDLFATPSPCGGRYVTHSNHQSHRGRLATGRESSLLGHQPCHRRRSGDWRGKL
ncbi:MAG: WXG100 family type VII secretion target [Ardenticatenales bacterium]|nr:WXG100 family type VII secretion target [Ardenticatenales bacterium]MCB9172719.1 WXG100 family type VII secretion target [Ardenticatenales bacterium]